MEGSVEPHGHRRDQKVVAGCAILIISDSRSNENDISGKCIKEMLEKAGHHVVESKIIRNNQVMIQNSIVNLLQNQGIQVIITSGGTGISRRDVTVDTLNELFEKVLTGFGETFRRISWAEVGAVAVFSRATAGIIDERVIFCLPGSPAAVTLALDKVILPSLGHLLWEATR